MFLNVFSCEGAVEQALTYMDLTGRGPATRRDMRAFRRVTTGYLSVESYVRSVTDRYEGVHSSSGRKKACRITVPGNRLGTRDGSILATAERKIYPARLVHEFRFGTVPDCTVRDVASLNARLCGDLYPCAGEFRAGTDTGRLDALLSGFRDKIRARFCSRRVSSMALNSAFISLHRRFSVRGFLCRWLPWTGSESALLSSGRTCGPCSSAICRVPRRTSA